MEKYVMVWPALGRLKNRAEQKKTEQAKIQKIHKYQNNQLLTIPMTLSDLHSHSPNAILLKYNS